MSSKQILVECREQLGPAPRKLTIANWNYWRLFPPEWVTDQYMGPIFRDQQILKEHGRIVWGAIVMANHTVFGPGSQNAPAVAVYSTDPWFDDNLEALKDVARRAFELKNSVPENPALRPIAAALTNEQSPVLRMPFPLSFAQGRETFYAAIMIQRKHIPGRMLAFNQFPLLVAPERTEAAMILPGLYWPEEIQHAWRQAAEARRNSGQYAVN